MLRSVYLATLWEKRRATFWWLLSLFLLAAWVIAFFPAIRDSPEIQEFITDFPPELLAFMGIDAALFTTGFGYLQGQMYSLIAPIIVIGLAVSVGAAATAGEEQDGTLDLLLATPLTRTRLLTEKFVAMVTLVAAAGAVLILVLLVANPLVDLGLSVEGIVAINVGLVLLGVLFGSLAMVIGAWRGQRSLALGVTVGAAATAFLIDGFAPLIEGFDALNAYLPFAWYAADQPLRNGFNSGHVYLLIGVIVLAAASAWLFRRRNVAVVIPLVRLPRWRGRERAMRNGIFDPLLGGVFGKTVWERRTSVWWWLLGLGATAGLTILAWPSLGQSGDDFQALLEAIPQAMLAMFGITDAASLSTAEGFLSSRIYSSVGPLLMLIFAVGACTAALAGEERRGTMDLLLGTPTPRDRVAIAKAAAVAVLVAFLVVGLWLVVIAAGAAVDMGLSTGNILAANTGLGLLALFFGFLALAVGARTGRPSVATGAASGVAGVTFLLNGFGAVIDWLEPARWASPFFWFLRDSPPAGRGFTPTYFLLLAGAVVFATAAVLFFRRRNVGT